MRKIIFVLIIKIIMFNSFVFSNFVINYEEENNATSVFFIENINYNYNINPSKTVHKIYFDENVELENKEIFLQNGPISSVQIKNNEIILRSLIPIDNIDFNEKEIIFFGSKGIKDNLFSFSKIKLADLLIYFFDYYNWQYIILEPLPDIFISFKSEIIYIEHFLRMINQFYDLDSIFYDIQTLIIGKNLSDNITDLPEKIYADIKNNMDYFHSNEQKSKNFLEEEIIILESLFDLKELESFFNAEIKSFDNLYVAKISENLKNDFLSMVNQLNEYISEKVAKENFIEEHIIMIYKSEFDLTKIKNLLEVEIIGFNEYFLIKTKESNKGEIINIIDLLEKNKEDEFEVFGKNEKKTFYLTKSNIDLNFFEEIYDIKIKRLSEKGYYIYGREDLIEEVVHEIELINKKFIIDEEKMDIKMIIELIYCIHDIMFLDELFDNLFIHKIRKNYYLLNSYEENIHEIKIIIDKLNTNITLEDSEEKKEETFFQEYFIIHEKIKSIFDIILYDNIIKSQIIYNFDNKYLYCLELTENTKEFIDDFLGKIQFEDTRLELTITDFINLISYQEKLTAIIDIENNDKIVINNYDLNLRKLFLVLNNYGINYYYLDSNTVFFTNKSLSFKYEFYIFIGKNINSKIYDFETLIEIYENIQSMNLSFSNSYGINKEDLYLVSNPTIFTNNKNTAEMYSVLSIPIVEKDEIISKIETGLSVKLDCNYNFFEKRINSNVYISLSEIDDISQKSTNERFLATNISHKAEEVIKLGTLSFNKKTEKNKRIPIISNIPIFKDIFSKTEIIYTNFDMIILLKVEHIHN